MEYFFAWGDWSVAAVVPAGRIKEFGAICQRHRFEWRSLGEATAGNVLTAQRQGIDEQHNLAVIRNENFLSRGFNAGLSGHLDYILKTPLLPKPREA